MVTAGWDGQQADALGPHWHNLGQREQVDMRKVGTEATLPSELLLWRLLGAIGSLSKACPLSQTLHLLSSPGVAHLPSADSQVFVMWTFPRSLSLSLET